MPHSPRFLALVNAAKTRIREVSAQQVAADLAAAKEFVLIDTREESEWNAARAQGARHLSKGVIERDIEAAVPDLATRIVLYCGGGYRSALAADALQEMGYREVHSLAGGWRAWIAAKLPVEQG